MWEKAVKARVCVCVDGSHQSLVAPSSYVGNGSAWISLCRFPRLWLFYFSFLPDDM